MQRSFFKVSMAVFLVLAFASVAMAVSNVANTSPTGKGNLLVFPFIKNKGGYDAPTVYTNIYIGNDSGDRVDVKCYWMNHSQVWRDFYFPITRNQSVVFSTVNNDYGSPFDPNDNGTLICWAQDNNDRFPSVAANTNSLYGYAEIVNTVQKANVFYNATTFFTRDPAAGLTCYTADGAELPCADARAYYARINLNGTTWDACPSYLITSFIPDNATLMTPPTTRGMLTEAHPGIAIWPCRQDFHQGGAGTYTKLKFDIWNWNEVKYTNSAKCIKCFYEGLLKDIDVDKPYPGTTYGNGYGAMQFTAAVLGDEYPVATLRIQGVASTVAVCGTTAPVAVPVIGLVYYRELAGSFPVAAYNMHGAGRNNTGWVQYDLGGTYESSVGK